MSVIEISCVEVWREISNYVDGDLDPECRETLVTALRAVLDSEARSGGNEERRTPAQRRADALGEICRQWLDLADRPSVAGERPHITVTVDLYSDYWASLKGVMVQGRAKLIERGPAFQRAKRKLYEKYPQYPEESALEEGDVIVEVTPRHVFSWGLE